MKIEAQDDLVVMVESYVEAQSIKVRERAGSTAEGKWQRT